MGGCIRGGGAGGSEVRLCKGQAQEVEDGGASVLFDYLFSYGCVGQEGDPEYKKERGEKNEKRPDQTQTGWKIYCECSGSFFVSLFLFFLFKMRENGL